MNSYVAYIGNYKITVPDRVYSKWHFKMSKSAALCYKSRYHNGYVREKAIRELLKSEPTLKEIPYILLALADYVIEISELPITCSSQTKKRMKQFAKANPEFVNLIEAKAISYWNEYYRNQYVKYSNYPPYAFLQSLKTGRSLKIDSIS